jgi:hypothetical protein
MLNGKVLHCGNIDIGDYKRFLQRVNMFLQKATERKGESRSAGHNEQGHQKTPVALACMLEIPSLLILLS